MYWYMLSLSTTYEISTLNQFHFPSPKPSGTRRQLAKPARIDCEAAVGLLGEFIQSGEEFAALEKFFGSFPFETAKPLWGGNFLSDV